MIKIKKSKSKKGANNDDGGYHIYICKEKREI